ncbi:MAG: DUF2637 domain-containing protein [Chloroflexota bacterium]
MSGATIVPPTHFESQKKTTRLIAWLTGILTLLMASFSFILSFNALAHLAQQHHVSIPILFPLVVESGVVIFSLNALYRSLHHESTKLQWGLVIASSICAAGLNILHADGQLVSQVMAAMPSIFLLLSFETLIGQIKHSVLRSNIILSFEQLDDLLQQKQADIERFESQTEQLHFDIAGLEEKQTQLRSEIAALRKEKRTAESLSMGSLNEANAVRQSNKQQALEDLIAFYSQHPNASLSEAGESIGRSKSTVSNYLDELEAAGRLHRNDQGVEIDQ